MVRTVTVRTDSVRPLVRSLTYDRGIMIPRMVVVKLLMMRKLLVRKKLRSVATWKAR